MDDVSDEGDDTKRCCASIVERERTIATLGDHIGGAAQRNGLLRHRR